MQFQVVVFLVLTPLIHAVGYQRVGNYAAFRFILIVVYLEVGLE
jgi:hypothetical protein